jgi:hypothetical protein
MPTKSEFDRWRERLHYAKTVWKRKGMYGVGGELSTLRMLIEFYRSNQWANLQTWGGLDSAELTVVNKVFPMANALQGEVASRNPRVEYFPRKQEAKEFTESIQALHNYDIREQNHIRQLNAAFRDHLFAPVGVIRHGYTPEEELRDERTGKRLDLYRPANPNRPWIRRMPIWDVLLDPRAESWQMDGGARWCAFRSVMTLEQIKSNPNMIAREDLEGFSGNLATEWQKTIPREIRESDDPDRESYVEVWSIYEIESRTWLQMTLDGVDKFLRKPEEWPIPWEWLPVNVFGVNEQMDSPFPVPLLEDVLGLQQELNKLRTMMSQFVRRIRRIMGVDKNKVEQDELNRMVDGDLVEFFETLGAPKDAIQQIQSGGFPQELLQYNAVIEEDMRESIGQSKMGRGQRINVESATEAAQVQQGQDANAGRIEEHFTRFVREVEQLYMQGRRWILQQTGAHEVVRIVGSEGVGNIQKWVEVTPEALAAETEFEVEAGSTRRRDRDREAQQAGVDLSIAQQLPQIFNVAFFAQRYLEKRGLDPTKGLVPGALQSARVEGGAALLGSIREGQGAAVDANALNLINSSGRA